MAAFFPNLLNNFLSPAFLEGVRQKYHYDKTQAFEFQVVAEEMLPLISSMQIPFSFAMRVKSSYSNFERVTSFPEAVFPGPYGVSRVLISRSNV